MVQVSIEKVKGFTSEQEAGDVFLIHKSVVLGFVSDIKYKCLTNGDRSSLMEKTSNVHKIKYIPNV